MELIEQRWTVGVDAASLAELGDRVSAFAAAWGAGLQRQHRIATSVVDLLVDVVGAASDDGRHDAEVVVWHAAGELDVLVRDRGDGARSDRAWLLSSPAIGAVALLADVVRARPRPDGGVEVLASFQLGTPPVRRGAVEAVAA